jgi:hypothetical protein
LAPRSLCDIDQGINQENPNRRKMKVDGGLERNCIVLGLLLLLAQISVAFTSCSIAIPSSYFRNGPASVVLLAEKDDKKSSETTTTLDGRGSDNKAMAFLRRIGKVGGTAQQDFTNAVGVDEGPAGKNGQAKVGRS